MILQPLKGRISFALPSHSPVRLLWKCKLTQHIHHRCSLHHLDGYQCSNREARPSRCLPEGSHFKLPLNIGPFRLLCRSVETLSLASGRACFMCPAMHAHACAVFFVLSQCFETPGGGLLGHVCLCAGCHVAVGACLPCSACSLSRLASVFHC